jgi:hypothetical protein
VGEHVVPVKKRQSLRAVKAASKLAVTLGGALLAGSILLKTFGAAAILACVVFVVGVLGSIAPEYSQQGSWLRVIEDKICSFFKRLWKLVDP